MLPLPLPWLITAPRPVAPMAKLDLAENHPARMEAHVSVIAYNPSGNLEVVKVGLGLMQF